MKYNSRPSYKDVKNFQIISANNNTISVTFPTEQEQYGDAWLYVAVLPEYSTTRRIRRTREFRDTTPYEIGFVSADCSLMDKETHEWVQNTCEVIVIYRIQCCNQSNSKLNFFSTSNAYYRLEKA